MPPPESAINLIKQIDERRKALNRRLEIVDAIEIVGIVDPSGAGASGLRNDDPWRLSFALTKWKVKSGNIESGKLDIFKYVSKSELAPLREKIRAYDILRLRARVSRNSDSANDDALLVDLLGREDSDVELNTLAYDLQKPFTFEDSQFGVFTLDRRVNWFETNAEWNSKSVRLTLNVDEDLNPSLALQFAKSLWAVQNDWNRRILDIATAKLLKTKNDNWLQEGEEELTATEFQEKMSLESIGVSPSGHVEFWFNDGDLFWGHSIEVRAKFPEGPSDAGIAG